jgi:elongation factor P
MRVGKEFSRCRRLLHYVLEGGIAPAAGEYSCIYNNKKPPPSLCSHMMWYSNQNAMEYEEKKKKQANDVRVGNVISLNEGKRLVRVMQCSHIQGAARQLGNVQMMCKDLVTNAKVPLKYKTKDMVDIVRLEERVHQYLYEEQDMLHFMDSQFNQVSVSKGDASCLELDLLKEGDDVTLEYHGSTLISVSLPTTVALVVSDAAPHMKNATQQPQYKPIVLETGARIQAPPYIKKGDVVLVDTSTREFIKRM